jgi:hypothetical protein
MNTLTVDFTFNLDEVNNTLGNTPNVGARAALAELIMSAISEYDPELPDFSFKIIGDEK